MTEAFGDISRRVRRYFFFLSFFYSSFYVCHQTLQSSTDSSEIYSNHMSIANQSFSRSFSWSNLPNWKQSKHPTTGDNKDIKMSPRRWVIRRKLSIKAGVYRSNLVFVLPTSSKRGVQCSLLLDIVETASLKFIYRFYLNEMNLQLQHETYIAILLIVIKTFLSLENR